MSEYEKGFIDGLVEALEIVKFEENEFDGIVWAIRNIELKIDEARTDNGN